LDDNMLKETYNMEKQSHRSKLLEVVEMVQDELTMVDDIEEDKNKNEKEIKCYIVNGAVRYFFEAEFEVFGKKKQKSIKVEIGAEEQKTRLIKRIIKQVGLAVTEILKGQGENKISSNQGENNETSSSTLNYHKHINVSASPFEMFYRDGIPKEEFISAVHNSKISELTLKRWIENFKEKCIAYQKWINDVHKHKKEQKKNEEKEADKGLTADADAANKNNVSSDDKPDADKDKADKDKPDTTQNQEEEEEEEEDCEHIWEDENKKYWYDDPFGENKKLLSLYEKDLKKGDKKWEAMLGQIFLELRKRRWAKNTPTKDGEEDNANEDNANENKDVDSQSEQKIEFNNKIMTLGPNVNKKYFFYGNTIFIDLTQKLLIINS